MGQRHQLFVIAKVLGRYRSLAAIHHQWLWGRSALDACLRLIQVWQDPHNRRLIEHEIAKAAKLGDEHWNREAREVDGPMFPFLTTCLVLGTGFNPLKTADSVSGLPWNMDFDKGDNNDGVTIFDISQPDTTKYCFVKFGFFVDEEGEGEGDLEDIDIDMTPIRGAEYLATYYKKSAWTEDMKQLAESLDKFPLVSSTTLNEAWPRPNWISRIDRGLQPAENYEQAVIETTRKPLASIAMENSIERILDHEDDLLSLVEELPIFQPSLKEYLYKHPNFVSSRRFGFEMLQKALADETILDLSPFNDLSAYQVVELIESSSNPLDVLDISGNKNITPEVISKIMSNTLVKFLYAWDNPSLLTVDLLPFVKSGKVKELFHPDLFAAPFRALYQQLEELHYGRIRGSSVSMNNSPPISPFKQLAWIISLPLGYANGLSKKTYCGKPFDTEIQAHMKSLSSGISHMCGMVSVSLHDVILGPSELLSSLMKLMRIFANDCSRHPFSSFGGDLLTIPYAFALRNEKAAWAVSPIPEWSYIRAKAAYHSTGANIQRTTQPLVDGEWTVLVFQDRFRKGSGDSTKTTYTDRFHLAFLTQKEGRMKVLGAKGFMEQFDVGHFATHWERAMVGLQTHAEKKDDEVEVLDCEEEIVKNIMALMELVKNGEVKV